MKSIGNALVLASLLVPLLTSASTTVGTIDATNEYAWSQNLGWINFGTSQGNVQVTDSQLTGYAWNENTGWINLAPSGTVYVHNDGNGNLSGYAWGEGIGYIDFSGVTIDASGYFHGYATATISGKISFNCANGNSCGSSDFKVQTDWRPANSRATPAPVSTGGGNGSAVGSFPASVVAQAPIIINDGATTTLSSMVQLTLTANTVSDMELSNDDGFSSSVWEAYAATKSWQLSPGSGTKTVYVRYRNASGATSPVAFQSISVLGAQSPFSEKSSLPSVSLPTEPAVCTPYLTKYIRSGGINDPGQVSKLQTFLQAYKGDSNISVTGVYDTTTRAAVLQFQTTYAADILEPWSIVAPTGYVFRTTLKKINEIYCAKTAGLSMTPQISRLVPSASPLSIHASSTCPYFTKRLIFNSTNSLEVPKVQNFLKSQGLLDTSYPDGTVVDKKTLNAIKMFQTKYASDILSPNGLLAPSGYWLSSSLKKANELVGCNSSHD